MTPREVYENIMRDAVSVYSAEGLKEKLESGRKLRVKMGADPSRPDLHLGHSVVLRKLKMLQDLGHEIIFVIGDFTGMIGDPSGRSKTRVPLTFEETRRNAQSYLEQVTKILDKDKTIIAYNSEWLGKMNFADVLSLAGKYTVARIMERDDFSKRFKENQAIGIHELLYPLMQGYDSVALRADIEVGGTDQTFNLLVGRELQKDYGQPSQEVITFPLLPGLDGVEKMSKSLDNYIGIDEPADIMFEKCMKVPDHLLLTYFNLTTDLKESDYKPLIEKDIREAHFLYASAIVRLYHGEEAVAPAAERYRSVAKGGIPDNIDEYEAEAGSRITALLVQANLAPSISEARRLIQGNGIKLDGELVSDVNAVIDKAGTYVLSKGKNKFAKFVIK
ncbi:MAG TPA: tyrosine--tRNA ligase [Bacillota bacterium]|nr:tyrosine--tRNA ligase [Bacillota bacterium]HOK69449.1 tyrosine--tRNA ligase [Bacillota bacterium]HPP84952.1 tyrosine--tRNA ligase [Bacillota bacterium]